MGDRVLECGRRNHVPRSIACSFLWHWWAFIAGFVLAVMILKATRRSKADFVVAMLATNREARAHFVEQGLIWEAPTQSVVRLASMFIQRTWRRNANLARPKRHDECA